MDSGIYTILNKVNSKLYIGSATNLVGRKRFHWSCLKNGSHQNRHLQRAWNKYGEASFEFIPLLICDTSKLLEYEQLFLDTSNPDYNIYRIAGSPLGIKRGAHTVEWNKKIGDGNRGKVITSQHRASVAEANRCRIFTDSMRDNLRKFGSLNPFYGKKHTEESRHKMSSSKLGKPGHKHTEEYKKYMSDLMRKRVKTNA